LGKKEKISEKVFIPLIIKFYGMEILFPKAVVFWKVICKKKGGEGE